MQRQSEQTAMPFPFGDGRQLDLEDEYAQARATDGLFRVSMPYGDDAWLVTRMADAKQVLTDRRLSRAAAYADNIARVDAKPPTKLGLLSLDGAAHREVRSKIAPAFSAEAVAALRPWLFETAERLWTNMTDGRDRGEFVIGYARELPALLTAKLFGIPEQDWPRFRYYADGLLSVQLLPPEETMQRRRELFVHLAQLLGSSDVAEDGLLARLAAIEPDHEDTAHEYDATKMALAFFVGGFENTAQLLANVTYLVVTHPELAEKLTDPDAVPRVAEELMRFTRFGAAGAGVRVALEDVEIGGQTVRRGEAVIVSLTAANHDPSVSECPDRIIVDRPGVEGHVSFGFGPHNCVASRLAKAEIEISLRTIFGRGPRPRLAEGDDAIEWRNDNYLRGLSTLWLEW